MMIPAPKLPEGFADLQPFASFWIRDTVDERIDARCSSPMEHITEFYDAAIVRAADMLDYLDAVPLDDLTEEQGNLMKLLLGLVHASIAVEIQQQPLPPKTDYPFRVRLVSGVAPFG